MTCRCQVSRRVRLTASVCRLSMRQGEATPPFLQNPSQLRPGQVSRQHATLFRQTDKEPHAQSWKLNISHCVVKKKKIGPTRLGNALSVSSGLLLDHFIFESCWKSALLLSSGARDIQIGVDDDGFIFLGYEAEADDESEALWKRNYSEPIDTGRAREETTKKGCDCLVWAPGNLWQCETTSCHTHCADSTLRVAVCCFSERISVLFTPSEPCWLRPTNILFTRASVEREDVAREQLFILSLHHNQTQTLSLPVFFLAFQHFWGILIRL